MHTVASTESAIRPNSSGAPAILHLDRVKTDRGDYGAICREIPPREHDERKQGEAGDDENMSVFCFAGCMRD